MDDLKPDIAISSHPFVDGSLDRMEEIRRCDDRRGSHDQCGPHNPFLIGREEATRYMKILEQCAAVQLMRQQAGLDTDGIKYLP